MHNRRRRGAKARAVARKLHERREARLRYLHRQGLQVISEQDAKEMMQRYREHERTYDTSSVLHKP